MNRKYNHLYAIPYYLWLGLFVILPLVLVLGSSFFDIHGNFTLANYAEYFSSINYIKMTMNSFIYAELLTIITLAQGIRPPSNSHVSAHRAATQAFWWADARDTVLRVV